MTHDISHEIELLIRARYPILYLVSREESRVREIVLEIARRRKKRLFEWSATRGLTPAGLPLESMKGKGAASRDPLVALDTILEEIEPALYLLNDFHPYLASGNHTVVRRLKEVAQHLRSSTKSVLVSSPVLEVPPELEKEITVLDVPLPTADELGALLDRIVEEVRESHRIEIALASADRELLLKSALGLTLTEAENVFAKVLVGEGKLDGSAIPMVFAEKKQTLRKSGLLEYHEPDAGFEGVGGLDRLKEWLEKRRAAFTDRAREFGLPAPKGVLLLGVQGCGKSLAAKAVSAVWRLPLLRLDIGRLFGSLIGSSEENMRRAIKIAESLAPAILWLDEIEKALSGTASSGMTDGGTTARVFGTFLTWLSEKTAAVFVIATANDVSALPPELLRKGRFDEIFFVDLPSCEERRSIAAIHLTRRRRDPANFDVEAIARAASGYSGAEIEESIVSALFDAFSEDRELESRDILRAIAQTVPLSRTMEEKLSELRTWARSRARGASSDVAP